MYNTALLILGIMIGISYGIIIGDVLARKLLRKKLNNNQCVNCKHFKECLGSWEKLDDNNFCKLYQTKCEPRTIEENNHSMDDEIDLLKKEIVNIKKQIEENDNEINETFFTIGEDLEKIAKAVYPDEEE